MPPAALAALAAIAAAAAPPRPNVVHYLVDDLSPDLTSAHAEAAPAAAYGGGWRTPVLRRLVREGVAFRTAWAPAMCTPSRVSLLTGRYPSETGVYHNNLVVAGRELAPKVGDLRGGKRVELERLGPRPRAVPSRAAHA